MSDVIKKYQIVYNVELDGNTILGEFDNNEDALKFLKDKQISEMNKGRKTKFKDDVLISKSWFQVRKWHIKII